MMIIAMPPRMLSARTCISPVCLIPSREYSQYGWGILITSHVIRPREMELTSCRRRGGNQIIPKAPIPSADLYSKWCGCVGAAFRENILRPSRSISPTKSPWCHLGNRQNMKLILIPSTICLSFIRLINLNYLAARFRVRDVGCRQGISQFQPIGRVGTTPCKNTPKGLSTTRPSWHLPAELGADIGREIFS